LIAISVATAATAVVCLSQGGCAKALFPSNQPRTQYEAHDRVRNRYTPLTEPDVFGRPRPALRERLSQSNP
jgi:hypothetical protein